MSSVSDLAFVIGRITKSAHFSPNSDGSYSVFLPLAEHETYNGKQRTNYVSARKYIKTDKQVNFYKKLTTGKLIKVLGKIQGNPWKDKNNKVHFDQYFEPDNDGITILSKKPKSDNQGQPAGQGQTTTNAPASGSATQQPSGTAQPQGSSAAPSNSVSSRPSASSQANSQSIAPNSGSATNNPGKKVPTGGTAPKDGQTGSGNKKIDLSDDDLPF